MHTSSGDRKSSDVPHLSRAMLKKILFKQVWK